VPEIKESVKVLQECAELQMRKADDYQNENSAVTQAMYYPNGLLSILDMVNTKYLRLRSILEKIRSGGEPNFEAVEDTLKDLINYSTFGVAWSRGKVPGQGDVDLFNRPNKRETKGD
jgi:hypothetical protein